MTKSVIDIPSTPIEHQQDEMVRAQFRSIHRRTEQRCCLIASHNSAARALEEEDLSMCCQVWIE
jgi:hypothetical protein